MPVCMAAMLGTLLAALSAVSGFLRLKLIEPKRELVAQKQHLIDTAEQRVSAANLRANAIEKTYGIRKKELHHLMHPRKVRLSPAAIPDVITDQQDSKPALPATQSFVRPDEF